MCDYATPVANVASNIVLNTFEFVWAFGIPLVLLIYLYTCILLVVYRTCQIHHTGRGAVSASDKNNVRIQMDVIRMLVIVSGLFVLSLIPSEALFLAIEFGGFDGSGWFSEIWAIAVLTAFLNVCGNPFICAIQYDVVRAHLKWFKATAPS